jgi:hypothetical protein
MMSIPFVVRLYLLTPDANQRFAPIGFFRILGYQVKENVKMTFLLYN